MEKTVRTRPEAIARFKAAKEDYFNNTMRE